MSSRSASSNVPNRWVIAVAGVVMQLALGAVYAWSVFRDPLMTAFGWDISQVTLTFSITIALVGFAAFSSGLLMNRIGPRTVGLAAALLYGGGVFLASFSADRLWWLYLSYGVISGIGLGLGYIIPIATLVKWFPDRRGFITGIAVAGFGAGALLTGPIATNVLIPGFGVLGTFAILGIAYIIMVGVAALFMVNPPDGWKPEGWEPDTSVQRGSSGLDFELGDALKRWQWYALWAILTLNVVAGIAIISQAAPMAQEVTGVNAAVASGLVALISIANGAGRFLWAWFSDLIGRKWVFLTMFLLQAAIFFILPLVSAFFLFAVLVMVVLTCYGGGFGTMPAFNADYFGSKNVGTIYGLMITAWSAGGVLGPILIANIREATGSYAGALYIIAGIMVLSTLVPLIIRPPRSRREPRASRTEEARA